MRLALISTASILLAAAPALAEGPRVLPLDPAASAANPVDAPPVQAPAATPPPGPSEALPPAAPQTEPRPQSPDGLAPPSSPPRAPVQPLGPPAAERQGGLQTVPLGSVMTAPPLPPAQAIPYDPVRLDRLAGRLDAILSLGGRWGGDLAAQMGQALGAQVTGQQAAEPTQWQVATVSEARAVCVRVEGALVERLRAKGALDAEGAHPDLVGIDPQVQAAVQRGGYLYDLPREAKEGLECQADLGPTATDMTAQAEELRALEPVFSAYLSEVSARGLPPEGAAVSPFGELPALGAQGARAEGVAVLQASLAAVPAPNGGQGYHWQLSLALAALPDQ